jgi:hypothetical protein
MTQPGSWPKQGQPLSQQAIVTQQLSLAHGGGPIFEENAQELAAEANAVQPVWPPPIIINVIT